MGQIHNPPRGTHQVPVDVSKMAMPDWSFGQSTVRFLRAGGEVRKGKKFSNPRGERERERERQDWDLQLVTTTEEVRVRCSSSPAQYNNMVAAWEETRII